MYTLILKVKLKIWGYFSTFNHKTGNNNIITIYYIGSLYLIPQAYLMFRAVSTTSYNHIVDC